MNNQSFRYRLRRLIGAFGLLVGGNFAFATGYWILNQGRNNPDGSPIGYIQCLYMTVVTTFTVGYGELVPIVTALDRIYTMLVITVGIGTIGYALSQMTAFIVEGNLQNILERRKMDKRIRALHDHFLVCGSGDVGRYVIDELVETRRPLLVIDSDEEQLKKAIGDRPILYVVGDATDEDVLVRAGAKVASGVICTLQNDRDNLVLAMTCRQINPKLRIVAKAHDIKLLERLRQAGADAVVSPQFIGGLRLVSEMVRPTVVTFLDQMLRERDVTLRVEEVQIAAGSRMAGKRLSEIDLEQRGMSAMALKAPGSDKFVYVPARDSLLAAGCTIIVLGDAERVTTLRAEAAGV
jgi:voltage-gated potassium channel